MQQYKFSLHVPAVACTCQDHEEKTARFRRQAGLASGSESSSYRLAFTFSMVLGSDQLSQLPTFEVRERLVAKDRFGGVEQCESDWPCIVQSPVGL